MTKEWIEKKIKEAHGNAVDKGFYPEGEDKNIGELLMLIVSELGEALEAHRKSSWAKFSYFDDWFYSWKEFEKRNISFNENGQYVAFYNDCVESEIADIYIRLFDLMGYLDLSLTEKFKLFYDTCKHEISDNFAEELFKITFDIAHFRIRTNFYDSDFGMILSHLNAFCEFFDIPIKDHIEAKMAYNRTRSVKHGKEY